LRHIGSILGVALCMLATPTVAQSLTPQPNTILVMASGSVKTPPDTANLAIVIRGEGKTPDDATRALAAKMKAITNGLRSLDPTVDIRTSSVAIGEAYAGTCNRDADLPLSTELRIAAAADALSTEADQLVGGEPPATTKNPRNPCAVTGYIARSDASVRMHKIADAGTAVGLAGRLGASSAGLESFDLTSDDKARAAATAAAIANARAQAGAIAAGSGTKLGGIVSVADGTGDVVVAMEKLAHTTTAYDVLSSPPPVPIDIAPKPVVTSARLLVTFAVSR